ncbi:hypothetical protein L9F63_007931, partial [Diploptera punctata]
MQVATLFRETATLLGASMEAQDPSGTESQALKLSVFAEGGMKQEPHDDGYETSGDLELRTPQGDPQKLIKSHASHWSYGVHPVVMQAIPKKRGRKKKVNPEEGFRHCICDILNALFMFTTPTVNVNSIENVTNTVTKSRYARELR